MSISVNWSLQLYFQVGRCSMEKYPSCLNAPWALVCKHIFSTCFKNNWFSIWCCLRQLQKRLLECWQGINSILKGDKSASKGISCSFASGEIWLAMVIKMTKLTKWLFRSLKKYESDTKRFAQLRFVKGFFSAHRALCVGNNAHVTNSDMEKVPPISKRPTADRVPNTTGDWNLLHSLRGDYNFCKFDG